MTQWNLLRPIAYGTLAIAMLSSGACNKGEAGQPRPPGSGPAIADDSSGLPANHPPVDGTAGRPAPVRSTDPLPPNHPPLGKTRAASSGKLAAMGEIDITNVEMTDNVLTLTGVSFKLPAGWKREDPGMNSSAPGLSRKAQIRLPKTDNEPEDAEIAITHFPGMKGPEMNRSNLARWCGQVAQPDGRSSVEVAKKMEFDVGGVKVILIDVPGTLKGGGPMMGGGRGKENFRLLAAIVDHDKGPHFVKVTGPDAVVARYRPSIIAFLKSAKTTQ